MNKRILLVPIDTGLLLIKIVVTVLLSTAGFVIYIAGGLTIIIMGACVLFGLTTGDGVQQLLLGSTKLLAIIMGASLFVLVLRGILMKLKARIDQEEYEKLIQ